MKIIIYALGKLFSHTEYKVISLLLSVGMFGVLVILPVGRLDLEAFYYELVGLDLISLSSFSLFFLLSGTLVPMRIYLMRKLHESKKKATGLGIVSVLSPSIAGIFGNAVCPVCLAVIIGSLGVPAMTLTLLLEHRTEIFLLAAAVAGVSLYFSSKAIMTHKYDCEVCSFQVRKLGKIASG